MLLKPPDKHNKPQNLSFETNVSNFTYFSTTHMPAYSQDSLSSNNQSDLRQDRTYQITEYNLWKSNVLSNHMNNLNGPRNELSTGCLLSTDKLWSSGSSPDLMSLDSSDSAKSEDADDMSPPNNQRSASYESSWSLSNSIRRANANTRVIHKRLLLAPSCFTEGCICGHNFEFRDMVCASRKRTRCQGITIIPKTRPISAKLRYID
jgi:hypothetical protein